MWRTSYAVVAGTLLVVGCTSDNQASKAPKEPQQQQPQVQYIEYDVYEVDRERPRHVRPGSTSTPEPLQPTLRPIPKPSREKVQERIQERDNSGDNLIFWPVQGDESSADRNGSESSDDSNSESTIWERVQKQVPTVLDGGHSSSSSEDSIDANPDVRENSHPAPQESSDASSQESSQEGASTTPLRDDSNASS